MNRILLILVFIFSFVFSFGQPIVPRSGGSLTVGDSNSFIGNSFRVPLFFDTTRANTNRPSLDSMGKIIFTRDVNWFWGRVYIPGTSSHKWVPFANPSTNLNVNCGNSIGSHIVTWDSLLVFDVTGGPYVLCCDGIPRATLPTTVTLAPADSFNPRHDAIVLDSNGVHVITGEASPNPTFPQIDSCQILLTYVDVLTGQTTPTNITQTVIYDEFVQGEWDSLRTNLVTVDSLNPNFPIHGTVAALVQNYTTGNYFEFHTDTAVDLNNFSALKFYIRDSSAVRVTITWYLDNQPQTPAALAPLQNFNLNNYQVIVMPISSWRFTNNSTLANTIRFTITPISALDAKGLYIDWIQLQGGVLITNTSTTGLQSFSANGIDAVGTQVLNPNGPNTILNLTKPNQPPFTVYANDSSGSAPFRPTAVNLGTPMITGLLDPIHIQPSTTDGDLLFTENIGGTLTTVWDGGGQDTTFAMNWLRVMRIDSTFNDTLIFGSPFRDSAVLSFDTYVGVNGFKFTIENNILGNDLFILDPRTFYSTIVANNSSATAFWQGNADSANLNVSSRIVADDGASHTASVLADAIANRNTYSAITHLFNGNVGVDILPQFIFQVNNPLSPFTDFRIDDRDGIMQFVSGDTLFGNAYGLLKSGPSYFTSETYDGVASFTDIRTTNNSDDPQIILQVQDTSLSKIKMARNEITYTSSTHTFNFDTLFHVNDGNNDLLYIDPISFLSLLQANNGTAVSEVRVSADLANTNVAFDIASNNGSGGNASINGDAIAGTLVFTTSNQSIFHSGVSFNYTAQTGTYGILPTDYTIDCTANSFTVTLPTAVGIVGQFYFITNSGAGTITLATTGGQTFANIGGTPTSVTLNTKTGILVQSNGANWIKVSGF